MFLFKDCLCFTNLSSYCLCLDFLCWEVVFLEIAYVWVCFQIGFVSDYLFFNLIPLQHLINNSWGAYWGILFFFFQFQYLYCLRGLSVTVPEKVFWWYIRNWPRCWYLCRPSQCLEMGNAQSITETLYGLFFCKHFLSYSKKGLYNKKCGS